jgi:hypothetical protein
MNHEHQLVVLRPCGQLEHSGHEMGALCQLGRRRAEGPQVEESLDLGRGIVEALDEHPGSRVDLPDLRVGVATGHVQDRAQRRTDFELPSHPILGVSVGRSDAGLVERLERSLEMLGGLVIGVPAERPLAGHASIPCRVLGVPAVLEVDCQDRSQGRVLGTERRPEVLADHPMEPDAPGLGDLLVQNLVVERVVEPIVSAEGPVRPLGHATRLDQGTSRCQGLECRLQGRKSCGRSRR